VLGRPDKREHPDIRVVLAAHDIIVVPRMLTVKHVLARVAHTAHYPLHTRGREAEEPAKHTSPMPTSPLLHVLPQIYF
jgi:hypothetical protein